MGIDVIIGASLTALICIVKVLELDERLPSVTLYSITSIPFKFSLGTYEPDNPDTLNSPYCEPLRIKILKSSVWLSISLTGKSNKIDESSSRLIIKSSATGESFTGLINILRFNYSINLFY